MIVARDLRKSFTFTSTTGQRHLWSLRGRRRETIEVLRGVSFTISRGEVVGLHGANGSGKTTLMRLIGKVLAPTSGTVKCDGTVLPLLALGGGFQEHLTGRENVDLNTALLGISRELVSTQMHQIHDYSGLGRHFDMQLRYYSSGMRSRLGFSIAAHVEADILLLDEVFAVGDADFRKQALKSMEEKVRGGSTVVITSHDAKMLERICDRRLTLREGLIFPN